jgi:chromosome segregation ATPase
MKQYGQEMEKVIAHEEKLKRLQNEYNAKSAELNTKKKSVPKLSENANKVSKYKNLKAESDSMSQKIHALRQTGRYKENEGRDNQLTRIIAQKQKVDSDIATLKLDAKAIEAGEKELAQVAEIAKTTSLEVEALEKHLESLNSEIIEL